MVYIEPRYKQEGKLTHYRLDGSCDYDYKGKQIRKYKFWRLNDKKMSKRQMEKKAMLTACEFE